MVGGLTFQFRVAVDRDIVALVQLYADCALTLGPQVYSAEQVAAWASFGADSAAFRHYIFSATTWVATTPAVDGIAGFCGVDDSGEVHSLYVHPRLTRQGLGSKLLGHAMAQARAAGVQRFSAWATPFSRPVFARAGLGLVAAVTETYQGVPFERYRVETPAAAARNAAQNG